MNIMKLMCTAFAVTLVISACGKTEGTNALKSEARVENPGTPGTETPAAAPQEMAVSDALNSLWSSRDGFRSDDNCILLEGALPSAKSSTPVAFYKGACQATATEGKGKQDQEKGKELAFKLEAIEEVVEPVKGGKDEVVKPVEPKQQQKPVDRVYSLILKGTAGKSDKGEQVQATPDMKVGEFIVHTYYEIPEKGKEEQKGQVVEQEQGKPEQGKTEPEQGKVEPEQGKSEPEQGKTEPEQGKSEPEQGKTEPEQGKPEQGKDQVVEQEQGKPEQGKPEQEGKPEGIERTKLVLTKLCTDEFADTCEVIFDAGRFDAIRLLGVASDEQKGQVVEQEQGKQEQGKAEPEQGKVEPVKEEIQKLEQEKAQQQAKVEKLEQELAKGQEQLIQEQDQGKKEQLEQKQQQLQQEKQKAQEELKQTQEKVEQAQQKQELEEKQV